jgi:hypothetical protein
VPAGYDPSEVPVCEDTETRDQRYRDAERDATPFFAVERYDEGYAVTYDLLPAGYELSTDAREALDERLTEEIEAVVGDESRPTVEVGKSVGPALGTLSVFEREATAREIAAIASRTVLDESNWVTASPPGSADDVRRN